MRIISMAMKRVCLGLMGALIVSAYLTSHAAAQDTPLDLKYFMKVKTLRFSPDTLLIATIDQMDVDPTGRILVVDQRNKEAHLFDSAGTLQASLDPTICHPGFTFNPLTASFSGDKFIFVQNSGGGGWGFRFTTDGECLGRAHPEYTANRDSAIDPSGILYDITHDDSNLSNRVLRQMDSAGKKVATFSIPPAKLPNASRRVRGGGLIADGEHIFFASAVEADVLKLALDGTLVGEIELDHRSLRFPRRDLPPDPAAFLQEFGKWGRDITTLGGFFELTDQALYIQYHGRKGKGGYQVISKEGELIAEEMGLPPMPKFLHGEYGLLYRVIQPRLESEGELANPYIEVYRFIKP